MKNAENSPGSDVKGYKPMCTVYPNETPEERSSQRLRRSQRTPSRPSIGTKDGYFRAAISDESRRIAPRHISIDDVLKASLESVTGIQFEVGKMEQYEGYDIVKNPKSGEWEIFWKGKKVAGEFTSEARAEQWIDDQFPVHRF